MTTAHCFLKQGTYAGICRVFSFLDEHGECSLEPKIEICSVVTEPMAGRAFTAKATRAFGNLHSDITGSCGTLKSLCGVCVRICSTDEGTLGVVKNEAKWKITEWQETDLIA
jgi:hypothetical protein